MTKSWSFWADYVLAVNSTTEAVWVTTDGATTPTVGGAGVEQVPAGQSALIPNRQIKPSAVSITSTGHRRATTS